MRRFRYEYGAGPLHLAGALLAFALAGYGLWRMFETLGLAAVLPWLIGSIVGHDLVLLPLYSAIGLLIYAIARPAPSEPPRVAALNHVRVAAFLCAVLFAVWFPLILGLSAPEYAGATGQSTGGYLTRWLALSAAIVVVSALAYGVRLWRSRKATPSSPAEAEQDRPAPG